MYFEHLKYILLFVRHLVTSYIHAHVYAHTQVKLKSNFKKLNVMNSDIPVVFIF